MDSGDPKQKFRQADALYRQGRYEEALTILDELDATFPNTDNVMYPRALCLRALGRIDEALQVCEFMEVLFQDHRAQELKSRIQWEQTAALHDKGRDRRVDAVGKARSTAAKGVLRYLLIGLVLLVVVVVAGKLVRDFSRNEGGRSALPVRRVTTIDLTQPVYEAAFVFDPQSEDRGHVHASCIVQCPNGDLLAVWYENSPPFPTEQRDRSDDVRIGGSRKRRGAKAWDKPFVMSDTPGRSDNNPCMVVDQHNRLWLAHVTLNSSPNNTWDSAVVKYQVSSDYEKPGVPMWEKSDTLVPRVEGLDEIVLNMSAQEAERAGVSAEDLMKLREKAGSPLALRSGWMTRAHPLVRSDGTVLLPLASEHFLIAAMAMTNNSGETWTFSAPVPDIGVEQPSVVEFPDGRMIAYLRNNGVERSIKQTESHDGGMTWAPTTITGLPHPQAGIEAVLLNNGHLALVYNDKHDDPRDSLAVSISEDEGKTWKWTRHLEKRRGERFDYPSLIQAADGSLHVTYSYNLETIKHACFNEAWVQEGDR